MTISLPSGGQELPLPSQAGVRPPCPARWCLMYPSRRQLATHWPPYTAGSRFAASAAAEGRFTSQASPASSSPRIK